MSSNCLVFHTSGGFSLSPAAFLFLIFLSTESSSPWVDYPSLMSNCLLIILVIGSCVSFGGFPCRFSKCCFHSFILSCWFVAFNLAFAVLFLLLTSFIVCQAILDCLFSTESLILSIWFCMYSVCSFTYMLANSFCAFFFFSFRAFVFVGFFRLEAVFTSGHFSLTANVSYNQTGDISTLEGTPLKLVDKFTYLGSSVESTEKDIETRLTKAWTAINRLSIIWKSNLTDWRRS